jgi:hypothetical protein
MHGAIIIRYREVVAIEILTDLFDFSKGETKSSVRLNCGLQVDLRVLEEKNFGSALHYFTGSRMATGMSFFQVGGNLGMALGPLFITYAITLADLSGTFLSPLWNSNAQYSPSLLERVDPPPEA